MKLYPNSFVILALTLISSLAQGQVTQSSQTGFQIRIERELECNAQVAYQKLVNEFNQWYDASHSYSQKAENLSLDLDKHCMLETLPDGGFVRHMEIVFHQPGKLMRMTGGLGPLQGMGVSGAMTYAFTPEGDKSKVTMTYTVSGADFLQLDKIAIPVNQVLGLQLDRFQKHCNNK